MYVDSNASYMLEFKFWASASASEVPRQNTPDFSDFSLDQSKPAVPAILGT